MLRDQGKLLLSTVTLIYLFLVPACFCQSGAGKVQGTVTDSTGAVIPGGEVTIVNARTGESWSNPVNATGFYVFPVVPPGEYKLTARFPGMAVWTVAFTLRVSDTAVVDPVMTVAGDTTVITVADSVPLVTTTDATRASTLERARIEQLPLNGRLIQNLVVQTTVGMETGDRGNKPFGGRGGAIEYVQDGAVLTNRDLGTPIVRPPGMDTIEEFTVETLGSSAKMNRPAEVIITTKSGTNAFHGAAFETARNNGFGVARRRQDFYTKAPHLVRNEFGASIGGPVRLPKVYDGRNRSFFFFAWEDYRLRSGSTGGATVPTAAMRDGDFSGLIDANGRLQTLYDPWSTSGPNFRRTPYTGNIIPKSLKSPLAEYLWGMTALPTLPGVNPLVSNNYFGPSPNDDDQRTYTLRMDHRISDATRVFGRFTRGISATNSGGVAMLGEAYAEGANRNWQTNKARNLVLSGTHAFSPTFLLETLATYSFEDVCQQCLGDDAQDISGKLGLPNPWNAKGFPEFGGAGIINYLSPQPRGNSTRIVSLDLNFTKVAGRHEVQFGGRARGEQMTVLPDQRYTMGILDFASGATSLYDTATGTSYGGVPRTGHGAANLFIGVAGSYANHLRRGQYRVNGREYGGYLQDNFRVTNRLMLNLGLRVETYPAMTVSDNMITGFDFKGQAMILGAPLETVYRAGISTPAAVAMYKAAGYRFTTPTEAGYPAKLIHSSFDVNPRIGFAYRLNQGKRAVALRGGYGVYDVLIPLRTFQMPLTMNPPVELPFIRNYNSASQGSPDGLPNYFIRNVPTVIAGKNSRDVIDLDNPPLLAPGTQGLNAFDPDQSTTKAHQWNLTLEAEVRQGYVARVGYVGTHGSKIEQFRNYNDQIGNYVWYVTTGQPLPTGKYASTVRRPLNIRNNQETTYGNINLFGKTGWSDYNGATFELERRYKDGYAFQLFYVMSNAFLLGGEGTNFAHIFPVETYLPNTVPADPQARNRLTNIKRDAQVPKHRIRGNWIVDLPFGKDKWLGRNASGVVNGLIGGWQIAGAATARTTTWTLPTANWGKLGEIEIYGTKYPIQDCRSGTCIRGYLWYNGYIPANRINSTDASGKPNGVMGVPSNYTPSSLPVTPTPAVAIPGDPNAPYYETNTVVVRLNNGSTVRLEPGGVLHPWARIDRFGPWSPMLDASLFKAVSITEALKARINVDFFNVLNMPGTPGPNASTGIISLQNSANTARQLQLTFRLSW